MELKSITFLGKYIQRSLENMKEVPVVITCKLDFFFSLNVLACQVFISAQHSTFIFHLSPFLQPTN